jgi:hypothetical protein
LTPEDEMQFPSTKVIFATLGALVSAAAVVLGANGVPSTLVDWLKTLAAILSVAASTLAAGYTVTETRPAR